MLFNATRIADDIQIPMPDSLSLHRTRHKHLFQYNQDRITIVLWCLWIVTTTNEMQLQMNSFLVCGWRTVYYENNKTETRLPTSNTFFGGKISILFLHRIIETTQYRIAFEYYCLCTKKTTTMTAMTTTAKWIRYSQSSVYSVHTHAHARGCILSYIFGRIVVDLPK